MKTDPTRLSSLAIARAALLTPYGVDESTLLKTLSSMFTHRVDYADLFFQSCKQETWILEGGIVSAGSYSLNQGVGVRAIAGDRAALSYSHEISEATLMAAAATARNIARHGSGRVRQALAMRAQAHRPRFTTSDPLASLDSAAKVGLLERVQKMARAKDSRISAVMVRLTGEHDVVLVARHDGLLAADVRPLARIKVTVLVKQNGRREMGAACVGLRSTYDFFTDELLERVTSDAVAAATTRLQARAAPSGLLTIVMAPGWPGVLLHESIGHGLEADFNRKKSSAFAGRIGTRVAAPGITVVDDGTLGAHCGSLTIDDEGTPTGCTTLVEDGILTGYLQDTMNARLMKMPVTGNARRTSFAHLPMPRMTNTCMRPGDKDPAEIVASVKNGIYAANLGGGHVDITNGKFVFDVIEAYLIEDGKLTYPLKDVTLIGNGPDILTRVSMIGNDMRLDPGVGTCAKENQRVPIGVGQPTLRIDGMTVSGTA